uniref:Pullulanase/glycogen debranching enzyme n=1 Tax=Candidatus Kentrum eta TaxID=2126337 RepID=A0A450V5D8_9GAMM|nr:MAG: Pullulanase/glycogen debranching enzyme [Candidatus Kentron sp. H]VFJ93138.1 MAG: Pullulanase/glycogen debranching enzyme [Candidatus Kentron sp. H]VFJ99997.1 MAG: Pullulanase/glycogen debranching enzyme [Candidatus Kentron sp. H]
MNFLDLKSNHPLGAIIERGKTTFSLFAPHAKRVTVTFFQDLTNPEPETHDLIRANHNKGIWKVTHNRNLHGWYYYLRVYSPPKALPEKAIPVSESSDTENAGSEEGKEKGKDAKTSAKQDNGPDDDAQQKKSGPIDDDPPKILDPYALVAVGPSGPGIVWDRKKIKPAGGRKFTTPDMHDLVIVEAHIRDLLKHAPMDLAAADRLGFTGLEKWVRAQGCYFKSLGVNAVELLPLQEIGDHYAKEDYHWGYMPVNWFAPDSSYARCPESGSQISEFQSLVKAFHDEGFAVLIDVVYNHVGNPNPLFLIDRDYYFHLDEAGELTNWSGCGNDVRCDAPMARRLIIDSLTHFIECYDVDGFRFDLAHLMGIETLEAIESALRKVKPSVVLIAEPWSFRGHIHTGLKHTGFAAWNDGYREFVYQYLLGNGNQEGLHYYMGGSTKHLTARPTQTVNYVESHDDRCWVDKITENPDHRGDHPTAADRRRTHLACAIVMASLGVPMISAGQDGLRTKQGIDNSYREGDINAIDYQRGIEYAATHDYFRQWIGFRRSERGRLFRLGETPPDSFFHYFGARHSSATAIQYNADKSHGEHGLLFAINPHRSVQHIHIDGMDPSGWKQIADHERFEKRGLETLRFPMAHGLLTLPPLSCGLWERA